MKAFGIIMFVFGCLIAVGGLFGMSEIDSTPSWTCRADTAAQTTDCTYDTGEEYGTDPGAASRKEGIGIGVVVIGAGLIAGGLACAGASGGTSRPSVAPALGAQAYAGAATGPGAQPGPVAFGSGQPVYGQSSPPPPETGQQQGQPPTYGSGR